MTKHVFHRLILGLILLCPQGLTAQNTDDLPRRAFRLQAHLQKHHLRPRERNDQFGQDVHQRLINLLDPDYMIFEKNDLALLRSFADSLDNDLLRMERNYLDVVLKVYGDRLEENKKIVGEITAKMPDLQRTKLSSAASSDFATDYAERKERWKNKLFKDLENAVLYELKDTSYTRSLLDATATKKWEELVKMLRMETEEASDFEDYFDLYYLNAITLAYDPHTRYFSDEMNEQFTEELSSSRLVFGISYQQNLTGDIEITEILPGSSAWYSESVEVGAILKEIVSGSGQFLDLRDGSTRDLSNFFDGLESDSIVLTLEYNGELQKAHLVRSRVYADNDIIKTAVLEGDAKIGYIALPDFYTSWSDTSALGCANDVAKAILKLKKTGIEGLILDLRNNGGGSLDEAVDLVGIFIDFGPVLLVEDKDGIISPLKDFNRGSIYSDPLMVLINAESASASEVVAGTLQDYDRALIVGQTSYGKATGQNILPLNPRMLYSNDPSIASEGYVKTTNIGLYRMSKESAQQTGVQPDIQLPYLSFYPPHYEREEAHCIQLEPIEKKVYFTPLANLPRNELKNWYTVPTWMDSLALLLESQRKLSDAIEENLDLDNNHLRLKEFYAMEEQLDVLFNAHPAKFTPVSFQFDPEVLKISPYLGEYSRRFLTRLERDVELNEAFLIMLHWAKLK